MISCLDNEDWNVRETAIRWLGAVGPNDLARSKDVIAVLQTQLTKEETSQENEEVKTRRERVIQYAIGRLKMTLAQWYYSPGPTMPGVFQPATKPGEHCKVSDQRLLASRQTRARVRVTGTRARSPMQSNATTTLPEARGSRSASAGTT